PTAPPQRPVVFSPRKGAPGPAAPAPTGGAPSVPRPAISPRPISGAGSPTPVRNSAVTPGRAPINPFLANDPNAKERRLARALISDLVTYFPARVDEGLRSGTLRDLFAEEIKKSYEEYVEQVGREFADSTSHFKDALNEILAGGQSMFSGVPCRYLGDGLITLTSRRPRLPDGSSHTGRGRNHGGDRARASAPAICRATPLAEEGSFTYKTSVR